MYLCAKGIDFATFHNFSIGFWNASVIPLLIHGKDTSRVIQNGQKSVI
jgi:hypothetical protein